MNWQGENYGPAAILLQALGLAGAIILCAGGVWVVGDMLVGGVGW